MRKKWHVNGYLIIGLFLLLVSFVQASELSNWSILSSTMNEYRSGCGAVAIQGYLYAIGGVYASNDSVERAQILSNGNLGPWQYFNKVNTSGRSNFGLVTANNSIYIIGGYSYVSSGWGYPIELDSIERATVNRDSTLSSWSILSTHLVLPRSNFAIAVVSDRIYVCGGVADVSGGVTNLVEYANINPDGTLGTWVLSTTYLTMATEGLSGVSFQNFLYVAGGINSTGSVIGPTEIAQVYPDGELGSWVSINTTLRYHTDGGSVFDGQCFYMVGGSAFSLPPNVERAQLYSTGSVGDWQYVPSLNIGRDEQGVAIKYPYIYAVGGYSNTYGDLNSIEEAMIYPTAVEKKYWDIFE